MCTRAPPPRRPRSTQPKAGNRHARESATITSSLRLLLLLRLLLWPSVEAAAIPGVVLLRLLGGESASASRIRQSRQSQPTSSWPMRRTAMAGKW